MSGFCRHPGRYVTCGRAAPCRQHWPLPRRSNRSSLLVLSPPGLPVHHGDSPEALPGRMAHATARNVEFARPTSGEKGGASGATVMAVAAHEACERHGIRHGDHGQFLNVTENREALAEQEDGGGDEGEPDTLNAWQRGTEKHATLDSVTGPLF